MSAFVSILYSCCPGRPASPWLGLGVAVYLFSARFLRVSWRLFFIYSLMSRSLSLSAFSSPSPLSRSLFQAANASFRQWFSSSADLHAVNLFLCHPAVRPYYLLPIVLVCVANPAHALLFSLTLSCPIFLQAPLDPYGRFAPTFRPLRLGRDVLSLRCIVRAFCLLSHLRAQAPFEGLLHEGRLHLSRV